MQLDEVLPMWRNVSARGETPDAPLRGRGATWCQTMPKSQAPFPRSTSADMVHNLLMQTAALCKLMLSGKSTGQTANETVEN